MEYRIFKKYNIVYGEGIVTPKGRLSFPYLTEKKQPLPPKEGEKEQGVPKHEVTILLDKKDAEVKKFIKTLETCAEEMVPLYNQGAKNEIARVKRIVRDGDQSDHEKYPQEKGCWILAARSKELPDLLNAEQRGVDAATFKAGLIIRLVIEPSLSSGGMGYGLKIVQVMEDDGVRFGGTKQDYTSLLDDVNGASEEEESEEAPAEEEEETPKKSVSPAQKAKEAAQAAAKTAVSKKPVAGKGKSAAVSLL